jgi:hypothetical protein
MLAVILALVAAILVTTVPTSTLSSWFEGPVQEGKKIVNCRLDIESDGQVRELWITGQKLLKKLIRDPLDRAREDPRPARYVFLGGMVVEYEDGSTDKFALFHPWGRYMVGGTYMIADFSEMKEAVERAISTGKRNLGE